MYVTFITSLYMKRSFSGVPYLSQANIACVCFPLTFLFVHIKENALHHFVKHLLSVVGSS